MKGNCIWYEPCMPSGSASYTGITRIGCCPGPAWVPEVSPATIPHSSASLVRTQKTQTSRVELLILSSCDSYL